MKNYKHVYDIDRIGILQSVISNSGHYKIKFYDDDKHQAFSELLRITAEESLEVNDAGLKQLLINSEVKIIVPKKNDLRYWSWMGVQLSITDPDKIPLILFHHWKKLKLANWFLNHLEFGVIRCVVSNTHFDTSQHKKVILDWVAEQRKNEIKIDQKVKINFIENNKDLLVKKGKKGKKELAISIIQTEVEEVYLKFKPHEEEFNSEDNLKKILEGKKISEPVRMNCSAKFLVSTLIDLYNQQKVLNWKSHQNVKRWVMTNFLFFDNRKKYYVQRESAYLNKVFYGLKNIIHSGE